jgi:hypothetical protein
MADMINTNMALEGESALLVVLNGGDAGVEPEIEQTVAAAVRAGRPVRAAVGESTPVPAFFNQVET